MGRIRNTVQKNKIYWELPLLFLFVCITARAELVKKKQLLLHFDKVVVDGAIDVFIQPGQRNEEATIYSDSEIINKVSLYVRNRTLFVDANNSFNLMRRIPFVRFNAARTFPVEVIICIDELSEILVNNRANVTVSEIKSNKLAITCSGTGRFHLENIDCEEISMKHFGNGPVILKGNGVNNLDLLVTGNGPFFAQELLVQRAKVVHRGANNIQIQPSRFLDSRIFGKGSVVLHNRPDHLVVNQQGNGSVLDIIPDAPPFYDLNKTMPILGSP